LETERLSSPHAATSELHRPTDTFVHRHIGPDPVQQREMLASIGCTDLDELIEQTIPAAIRLERALGLSESRAENELLEELRGLARHNRVYRNFIGLGYYDCIVPGVIQRNILENPGWYTQYTPYQAEIAQGRLEALLNFQTLISDLTGLPLANASLLDEATAAAEALSMCLNLGRHDRTAFFVAANCHPQTIEVIRTRAEPLGLKIEVGDPRQAELESGRYFGILLQVPSTDGRIEDPTKLIEAAHGVGTRVVIATDPLALVLMKSPGEMGADIAVGSTQRFGVPMGFGGPHAAFLATREEFKRQIPGRIIGVSRDSHGAPALRLAMQTREQHIRRDKATSNICTAQVLLAIMAGMYAVYHGPEGLRKIARRVHALTQALAAGVRALKHELVHETFFDTLRIRPRGLDDVEIRRRCQQRELNLRHFDEGDVGIAFDERTTTQELQTLLEILTPAGRDRPDLDSLLSRTDGELPAWARREGPVLEHPVFHRYHSEHEMLRYLHRLETKDLSLTTSMIPLGSCTMKLNATSEMVPVTWSEFSRMHPFCPIDQTQGYQRLFQDLRDALAEITGLPAVSLQPNAGAQGEYTGLLVIRAYHHSRGEHERDACLIPVSAHGTNPASAVMAGMRVITIACDARGNIDVDDLRAKSEQHAARLAAIMITYPSTHGVFEESIEEICEIVHRHGGQVYLDGANMNAQVGLCRPGDMGADVCHLNLHKTFCIPHGGGGPGMGPIAVAAHLAPFLPGHPLVACGGDRSIGPVSAAPFGSPSILPISWMYIRLMGEAGLRQATQVAILNANYMAQRLSEHYPILYTGLNGRVAHEFILDVRPFKESAGLGPDDFAKRLMDYGFHAPTMSWPVAGTLMIEPTESESREELDRFCEAMIQIREEVRLIESGRLPRDDNPLRNAPHSAAAVMAETWEHPYSREQAAFPAPWLREHKFWPAVGRVDNAYGDRHLVCSCPPIAAY
jgi:glycine dehydrogenase